MYSFLRILEFLADSRLRLSCSSLEIGALRESSWE